MASSLRSLFCLQPDVQDFPDPGDDRPCLVFHVHLEFGENLFAAGGLGADLRDARFGEREPSPHRQVHSTIVIYDAAAPPATRFIGGRDNDGSVYAYAPMAQVMAHEFGHVIASRASLGDQFYKWVAESDTEPFTRYAASNPQTEFFPEAFALYLLDPGWIQVNYPDLFVRARAYASRPPDHW